MKEVINILRQIEATSSRLEKEGILLKNKDNENLKRILRMSTDPFLIYGIGKKSIKSFNGNVTSTNYDNIFNLLDWLLKNNTGSNQVVLEVNEFLANQDEEDKEWYERIILKDLRIGLQSKSINKVFPGLISEFNCMLAQNYFDEVEKLTSDFIVTEKLDGNRMVLVIEDGEIKFFTRQGQPVLGLTQIEEEAYQLNNSYVYDGEVLLNKELPSKDLFRETMKVVRKDGEKQNLVFHVFDRLPLNEFKQGKSKKNCLTRKTELHNQLSELKLSWIKEVPMLYVGNDKEKVLELLNEAVTQDKEGVMVSTVNGLYQTKRTKDLLKVKKFHTLDLRIVDLVEGDGRNKGKLGAAVVRYKGNTVNVGSGWSDSQREEMFTNKNKYIGIIIEVSYFEETNNSKTGQISLRFPTFSRYREDKTEESYY